MSMTRLLKYGGNFDLEGSGLGQEHYAKIKMGQESSEAYSPQDVPISLPTTLTLIFSGILYWSMTLPLYFLSMQFNP